MGPLNDRTQISYIRLNGQQDTARCPLSPPDQTVSQPQKLKVWSSKWVLETLSCVLSVGFLVAIVVVLANYDGKALPNWPYGITLNALVSVLSTFMKATMAFSITEGLSQLKWSWFVQRNKLSDITLLDSASRGPLGAAMVLFRFLPRWVLIPFLDASVQYPGGDCVQ